jgi:exodeoxyribonuclease III
MHLFVLLPFSLTCSLFYFCLHVAFKIASWNVAGLRAVLSKTPNVFLELATRHNLDVLCLQETKLQEQHLLDPKLNIKETMALSDLYDDYWSCSTAKKGYSGTAVFVRRRRNGTTKNKGTGTTGSKKQSTMMQFVVKKDDGNDVATTPEQTAPNNKDSALPFDTGLLIPTNVSYVMGKEKHEAEGRIIVIDFPLFSLCNVYVPNAGQKLERLLYRVNEWDKDFLQFVHQKQVDRGGLPVIWLGDLNVAHTNLEVWNDGAKHLPKQAGVTPEERASFQEQLDSGHIDAFRHLHPTASGHYSYWSMRAGNRIVNKGLRLDYFICDPTMLDENSRVIVRDSYMDYTQEGSDHCPVILELEIKGPGP